MTLAHKNANQITNLHWRIWLQYSINALNQTYFQWWTESAVCVQHSIDSRNSAIRSAYRILLRPSSILEPRHPPLKVVIKMINIKTQYNGVKKRVKRSKAKATEQAAAQQRRRARIAPYPRLRLWCWNGFVLMILPQVHLRKPCYDFCFL